MEKKEKRARLSIINLVVVGIFLIAVSIFVGIHSTEKWSSAPTVAWAQNDSVEASQKRLSKEDLLGVFSASLPSASSPGRNLELRLNEDGKARFIEDYLNEEPPVESEGEWKFDPDKQRVTIDFPDDKMIFNCADGKLELVDYDVDVWGEDGLSLTKNAN